MAKSAFSTCFGFQVRTAQIKQADQEERAGRQQQQAVGHIPAAILDQGQDIDAEQLAGTEQLAHDGDR